MVFFSINSILHLYMNEGSPGQLAQLVGASSLTQKTLWVRSLGGMQKEVINQCFFLTSMSTSLPLPLSLSN